MAVTVEPVFPPQVLTWEELPLLTVEAELPLWEGKRAFCRYYAAWGRGLLDYGRRVLLPPLAERCETAVRQIRMAAAYKGERVAVLEARKQYCWYLKGISHANYYKEQIVQMNTLEDVDRITRGIQRDLRD